MKGDDGEDEYDGQGEDDDWVSVYCDGSLREGRFRRGKTRDCCIEGKEEHGQLLIFFLSVSVPGSETSIHSFPSRPSVSPKVLPHLGNVAKFLRILRRDDQRFATYTLSPGLSSCVYSLIIVLELPPAPAARGEFGESSFFPDVNAAALRLQALNSSQYIPSQSVIALEGVGERE